MIGPSLPPKAAVTGSAPRLVSVEGAHAKNGASGDPAVPAVLSQAAPDFRSCAYFVLNSLHCDFDFSRSQN